MNVNWNTPIAIILCIALMLLTLSVGSAILYKERYSIDAEMYDSNYSCMVDVPPHVLNLVVE